MRHSLVILAVICAVIAEGWAQNRGSARYVPPEDFDGGDITRAPRPTRGGTVRRQRPTKAPEPAAEDELKNYQPPEVPSRTTGRRVPQRGSAQQVTHPPPQALPVEDPALLYPAAVEELPQAPPTTAPEGRPQGTRRRRPKKRRRPAQAAAVPKVAEEPEKQLISTPEEEKTAISELLNEDKKRNENFQGNLQSRHSAPSYDPEPTFNPEKTSWDDRSSASAQVNAAGPQYFRPQSATNRLPLGEGEPVGNSRRYLEPSPVIPDVDSPAPYVPKRPQSSVSNEASYVPVLSPVRGQSQGASRLPPDEYPAIIDKETSAQEHPTNIDSAHRGHGNRPPVGDPDEIIRNTGAKPVHNIIPQPDEPVLPVRGHSDVRLPQNEQPVLSEYAPPDTKATEEAEVPPNTSNRLPNPSEIHYDSAYPEFSERPTRGSQRVAVRRQEQDESVARNPLPSYTTPRRNAGTKPHEYDNDAEIDRRQPSEYRPPIQRGASRYKPEDSEGSSRTSSRTAESTPSTNSPRTRGSTRYQASTGDYVPERTRGSTRSRSEPVADPVRTESQTARRQEPQYFLDNRALGRKPKDSEPPQNQRYVPPARSEPVADPVRTESQTARREEPQYFLDNRSLGRKPKDSEPPQNQRYVPPEGYISVDETIKNDQRPQSSPPRSQNQPKEGIRSKIEPELNPALRHTLRSRPQYEVRDADSSHAYEESVEDPEIYDTEYQVPRQVPTRGRGNDRTTVARQPPPPPPPQPEYQAPRNRQQNRQEPQYAPPQNRQEPQYVPPQNPRYRHPPQYEASQNARSADSRQSNNRQNAPSSRPEGRSRQNTAPAAAPSRSSGSNFACPEPFGFFADPVQCDKYYECRNGTAEMNLCKDGLAFNEMSAPNFLRCDSLRDVDCKSRPELQEPQPTKNCPRRFGLFPHETDCTKFWNCVDGTASEVQCPPGLTYNNDRATCDWADLSESSCKTEDLLGFTCPEPTAYDLQDGVYTRYPHPDNCQLHFTCIKGADGLRRPRMLSCNDGYVYDPETATCARPEDVPGCEDFYGDRRSAPKRKPAAREPAPRDPAPREHEEEVLRAIPTPRPSRRGSNRRVGN